MTKIMLPQARPIWNMRLSGKKPNTLVFVSLIGGLNVDPTVSIPPEIQPERCEWRWTADLGITLVFNDSTSKARVWQACQSILRNAPNGGYTKFSKHLGFLWMWNTSSQIATLMSWWRGVDAIPEFDIEKIPEEFTTSSVSRWDRHLFVGVEALAGAAA